MNSKHEGLGCHTTYIYFKISNLEDRFLSPKMKRALGSDNCVSLYNAPSTKKIRRLLPRFAVPAVPAVRGSRRRFYSVFQ